MAAIGSSETETPLSRRFDIGGTNEAQTEVIGSSEIGDTPFQNQSNFVEPINFVELMMTV